MTFRSDSDTLWLTLSPDTGNGGVQVEVTRQLALALDRRGFARLYRDTVWGASRRVALAWADEQIKRRSIMLAREAEARG